MRVVGQLQERGRKFRNRQIYPFILIFCFGCYLLYRVGILLRNLLSKYVRKVFEPRLREIMELRGKVIKQPVVGDRMIGKWDKVADSIQEKMLSQEDEDQKDSKVDLMNDKFCAVCVDQMGRERIGLPCGHFIHGRCSKVWIMDTVGCRLCSNPY